MVNPEFDRTRKCVDHYRSLGLCPLPSRMDIKGPALPTYAEHYGPVPVPEEVYSDWRTINVQIITGTKSPTAAKILVVDCDGAEALHAWEKICSEKNYTQSSTWASLTGSGGWHYYFSLPPSLEECPSGLIWGLWDTWGDAGRGKWLKHKEVRILADNALVIAPPSRHVDTGTPYSYVDLARSPNRVRLPEMAPQWLLDMPRLASPRFGEPAPPPQPRRPPPPITENHYTRQEVLDAIGDQKFAIARDWGLVFDRDRPNPNGWVPCFIPWREDPKYSRPSGSFNWNDGTLQDRKDMSSISLFDLGALIGGYTTWTACRDSLGDRFIGKRCVETSYQHAYRKNLGEDSRRAGHL